MIKIKTILFCIFLFLITLSYGCPSVNKTYPERNFFLFEISNPPQNMAQISGTSVDVFRFTISPTSDGRQFIYRVTDQEYKEDFYNQFFRPPDNLMTEVVREWLNQSGLFENVLQPSSQALAEYIIEGNVIELYGDYRNPSAASAVMTIQLFLLRISPDGSDPSILMSKTYTSTIPIGAASPSALMNGWNRAFENILGEFTTDLSYHIKRSEMQQSVSTSGSDS